MTAKELAERLGVTSSFISQLERGHKLPPPHLASNVACILQVPEAFLDTAAPDAGASPVFHYRRLSRTPAYLRHMVEAQAQLFEEFTAEMEQYFEYVPSPDVPEFPLDLLAEPADQLNEAERAADAVRRSWRMGPGPIPDVVALLESRGIWVHVLAQSASSVDAFSYWSPRDGSAHILLNPEVDDPCRLRLDAAHELGHLVMHCDVEGSSRQREYEAFRFGAAFLVPASEWIREAPRSTNWREYLPARERWGLSVAALIRRSRDLGILDAAAYKSAMVQYSAAGLRRDEMRVAAPARLERPARLSAYLRHLSLAGVPFDEIVSALALPADIAKAITDVSPPESSRASRTHLRLVSS